MHIHNKINQLIEFVKEKTIESEKKGINNALSSQNYFVSWINTPGLARMKFFLNWKKNLLLYIKINIKFLLSIATIGDLVVFQQNDKKNSIYNKIIISWCTKKEFDNNGNFKDTRFNLYAKETDSFLWMLISLDGHIPEEIEKNVKIIKSVKNKNFILTIIKKLIEHFSENKFSIIKFFHYFNPSSIFAKSLSDLIIEEY